MKDSWIATCVFVMVGGSERGCDVIYPESSEAVLKKGTEEG